MTVIFQDIIYMLYIFVVTKVGNNHKPPQTTPNHQQTTTH